MRKSMFLLVVLLLAFFVTPVKAAPQLVTTSSIPNPTDYWVHVVIACGVEPDQVDIRFKPDMNQQVLVDGEIFASMNGVTKKIGGMPTSASKITQPYMWNGPEGRITNFFQNFSGYVWGWGKIKLSSGITVGSFTLPKIAVKCGQPKIDYWVHVVIACGVEPDQVDIRFKPDMNQQVLVDGEIFASMNYVTKKIGGMPTSASKITQPYMWNGPEGRITNFFQNFSGYVWGWGKISSPTGVTWGKIEVPKVKVVCTP